MKDTHKTRLPILIVDRNAVIAGHLIKKLKKEFLPIVLSGKKPDDSNDEFVYIPLRKKVPKIPENYFPYIFFIDSGDDFVRDLIAPLRKYALKHGAVLNILTSIYYKRLKNFEELFKDRQVKLFVAGDIFDIDPQESEVGEMLLSAQKGRMDLFSQGLTDHFPISAREVSRVLLKSIPVGLASRNLFLLYFHYPLTGLSVARNLMSVFPLARLNVLNKKKKVGPLWAPKAGEYIELTGFPEQLKEVAREMSEEKGSYPEEKLRPALPILASVGFFIILFFVLPLLSLLGFFAAGSFMTKLAVSKLESGNTSSAQNLAYQAGNSFDLSGSIATSFLPAAKLIGGQESIENYSQKISSLKKIDQIIIDLSKSVEEFRLSQIEPDDQRARSIFIASQNRLAAVFAVLSALEAEGEIPKTYQDKLKTYQKLGEHFLSVKEVLPDVLGYGTEKKYLVLFQNNNELRPGGGFIGSYGLAEVEKGSLKGLEIFDVYDADGQLTARVDPPYPLREHLGAQNWFLRDSNFAVEFPENAARAAYFLRLETGEEVDGVIAVDTLFIEGLLAETGPLKIKDFNKTVGNNNFSEILQSEIENDFFPGSLKKKQLLAAVYKTLTEHIENDSFLSLSDEVLSSLSGKHLLFAFADSGIQAPFTLANLSGSLWDGREEDEGVINDFLGIVEANLGENKVNPFIERQISQETSLQEDGELTSTVSIAYKNTSKKGDRFGGAYKNYLRFVFPFSANAISLKIDGTEKTMLPSVEGEEAIAERQRVSSEVFSVDLGEEKGKKTLGMLIEVPQGEAREVEVVFQTQTGFTRLDPKADYSLRLFKQPGRHEDPYLFKFSFPESYQVVSKSENVNTTNDEASAFFLLNEDKELEITLGKK